MGYHSSITISSYKTLPQHQGQLTLPVINLILISIECSDTLLERQQTLVNLRTVKLGLLAHVDDVRPLLAARQVNERHLGHHFLVGVGEFELEDGVRARGLPVDTVRVRDAVLHALRDQVLQVGVRGDLEVGQALHVHDSLRVFEQFELCAPV